jgi:hypothetical protein
LSNSKIYANQPQLATTALNFGVGRSQSFCSYPVSYPKNARHSKFLPVARLGYGIATLLGIGRIKRIGKFNRKIIFG